MKTVVWSHRGRRARVKVHLLTGDLNLTLCGREVPMRIGADVERDTRKVTCLRCIDIAAKKGVYSEEESGDSGAGSAAHTVLTL